AAPAAAPKPAGAGKIIESPLPGVIISVDVKEGQAVKRGQKVAVIEAMKMENEILAECDGTITAVHVKQGDSVLEGADIVTIG
ncbi:MAG: acetyl-CoA carboxylase biotin carboxyl carrier protein subunit, partial [Bacteroidales bacterium]|nr:acetyl-CoA carboxylase biotin carboxyl carrier protein subunit [Bacteroidales bacterium]